MKAARWAPGSSPRAWARSSVLPSTIAPAAELLPSIPSVPALSTVMAAELGLLPPDLRDRILALLTRGGLPTWSPLLTAERCETGLRDAARHRGGCVNLVVPTAVGRGDFLRHSTELPPSLVKRALEVLARSEREPAVPQHLVHAAWSQAREARL